MKPTIYLSLHFTLDELTASQTAARAGIDNTPPADIMENLKRTAIALEHVRAILGCPVMVSSGYRCPALNAAIGGSKTSAHMRGLAVDFTVPAYGPPLKIARVLAASELPFDQLIHEYGRWVHLGLAEDQVRPRRELLSIFAGTGYLSGIRAQAS